MSVMEAGADSDYTVAVSSADKGVVEKGTLVLDVIAGKRVTVDVQLAEAHSGAVKVVAHEI